MIPPNRIEQLNDFNYQLQRDDPLSNLRAMQALQQGIPSLMMGMPQNTGQAPMLNMSEGGITSLPVIAAWGGFNPFKPIQRAVKSIGKGIGKGVKGIGKGLSGIFKGLTGGGNFGDTLKTMALMAAFSMMGAPGGMNPHIWRAIYGGVTPGLARGKLKFDPMSAAMTVGGGYLGDKLFMPDAAGATKGGYAGLSGEPSSYGQLSFSGGVPKAPMPLTQTAGNLYKAAGNPNVASGSPSWFARNVRQPFGEGLDYVRDVASTPIPGAETLTDLGQTDVGLTGLNDLNPFGDKYNPFSSDMLFPDAAPTVGNVVTGGLGGYEGSQIYNEQAEAERKYNDWMADQEAAAERAQMPTREWLKRIVDDPVKFTYNYKGPLSYEELVNRYTQGAGDTETAQMFDPATFITESGRDPGMYDLGQDWDANARYGGYLPEIKKAGGGLTSLPVEYRLFGGLGSTFQNLINKLGGRRNASSSSSSGGGFGIALPLGMPMNNPDILRKLFPKMVRTNENTGKFQPMPRTDSTGEAGPKIEAAGIQQIKQPSAFERKGLMSQEEMTSYDNNMVLLLEENKKAVARKEPSFTLMGETFQTNPNGAPTPVGNQGPQIAMAARGGQPQFFSGKVPNTTNPNSDGMSDSETMLITDPTGKDPRGIMKISEQEYVMSAPDMAILGNGDPQAGAQLMDGFRENLRQAAYGTRAHQPRLDQQKALSSLAHKAFG